MNKLLITIAALGLTTGAVLAQAAAPSFATVDADTSGGVTLAEAQVAWPELTQEAFDAADGDKSGTLDQTEFDAYAATLAAPAQ